MVPALPPARARRRRDAQWTRSRELPEGPVLPGPILVAVDQTEGLDLDLRRWDFTLRFAFGIDAYITENWLVNLELAPSMRFADYGKIVSKTTDNVLLTIGAGVQYRW